MLFHSTNLQSSPLSFAQALLFGQAPDRGLYLPESVPRLSDHEIRRFGRMEYHKMAAVLLGRFMGDEIPRDVLAAMTKDAYNFDIPLENVKQRQFIMRLDQGPTASFKDFAARMMGRLMNYYLKRDNKRLLILTATSGDTGSAISHAFLGMDRIKVVVLFPKDEVTNRQRKQMTTLGQNINVLALDGKFDDCQAIVKQAFADPLLRQFGLSSANSINIGRLIPQMVYYFYAWSRLAKDNEKITFSVPSGNFGNMMGGVLAMQMGLPVEKFVIAVNGNDEFPQFLKSGRYNKIEPSRNCLSSAMNVGHPSNLARLVAMYGGSMDEKGILNKQADLQAMQNNIWSTSVSDELTRLTIRETWENHHVLLEPHGAVGWAGLQNYLQTQAGDVSEKLCVSLETAHPAKFPEEIIKLLGFDPALPLSLEGIENREEHFGSIPTHYESFRDYLMKNYEPR
ncbi:MAG: threonine synthase [Bacteroidales bacterium]|nr:threonine synthase [Bacteroidales bacterium]